MDPRYRIDDQITTTEGYTFVVVDIAEDIDGNPEYVVRADLDGNDMAFSDGIEGFDWQYVYIPEAEVR